MFGGLGYASASYGDSILCFQDHVEHFYIGELSYYFSWTVSKSGLLRCFLERFPEDEREKTHQDMGRNPVRLLMPNRSHFQVRLVDPEGLFRVGELDICLPQILCRPVGHVALQDISSFRL